MANHQIVIFLCYLSVISFGYWLQILNLRQVKRSGIVVPPEFAGHVDNGLLERTRDYTIEQGRFGLIESVIDNLLVVVFFFGGLIDAYNSWILSFHLPFVFSGTLFFLLLVYAKTLISLPFSIYRTFGIENRYGFNTMTTKLWVSDLLKSVAIETVLLGLLSVTALFIISVSPVSWWFIIWLFFLLFSLFFMYLSPYVIEPLFNKFAPLDDKSMEASIKDLMKRAGLKISRVFQVDASKRSRHTNAYFTGVGRVKRIVLYDTLLNKLDNDEVLSVLAHEAGHWKKKHILKRIVLTEALSFVGFYISFRLIRSGIPRSLFSIHESTIFSDLLILGFLGGIVSFPLTPLLSYLSRRHEREADRFAVNMTGNAEAMATSLIKLSKDNLSNLHPHPLYAAFHYSHPPVVSRVREIRGIGS